VTDVTNYAQIVVVVRGTGIATRNNVMNIECRRVGIPTNLTLYFLKPRLLPVSPLHSEILQQGLKR